MGLILLLIGILVVASVVTLSARDADLEIRAFRKKYRAQAARGFAVMAFGTALCGGLLVLFGAWA